MKYLRVILFFILCCTALQKVEGRYPEPDLYFPLAIACNTTKRQCVLSDAKTFHSDLSSSNNPGFIKILHCCHIHSHNSINMLMIMNISQFEYDLENKRICYMPYKPSVLMSTSNTQSFQIGYAISKETHLTNEISLLIPEKNKKQEGYFWFSEIRNMYNTQDLIAIRSKHRIFPHRHSKTQPCLDFQVGIEKLNLPDADYIENLYSPTNQIKVLQNVTSNTSSRGLLRRRKSKEKQDEIVIQQLVPIDDFIEDSLKICTCSYLNTVPLMKRVAEGSVQAVENYIRKVVDVLGKTPLNIWTEVYYESTKTPIYLLNENGLKKLQIPSHFIKIISYPLTTFSTDGTPQTTEYYIAIVIHNEIQRTGSKICKEIVCQEYGWNIATIEGGLTYCCELDDLKSITKIDILPTDRPTFDLHHVPLLSNNQIIEINAVQFLNGKSAPLTIVYYPDRKAYELIDLEIIRDTATTENQPMFSHIILCCPPETTEEEAIRSASKVDNLLFIKGIFRSIDEIPTNLVCELSYLPTAMYSKQNGQPGFEMGYAIKTKETLMNAYEFPDMQKFQDFTEYAFISIFWIAYNQLELYSPLSIHVITSNATHSRGSPATCDDMTLGIELVDGLNANTYEKIYSKVNQKKRLKNFSTADELFVPHKLVPTDDFQNEFKYATCSYLNTAPIYKSISEGPLQNVENFIRSAVDQLNSISDLNAFPSSYRKIGKFEITTVLHQVLELPLKYDLENKEQVFLDVNDIVNVFPVPKLVMKIVAHKVPLPLKENQDSNTPEYKIYAVVIVIHNELPPHSREICEDLCPALRWDIEIPDREKHLVYCCSLEQIQKLVGVQSPYGDAPTENFNLEAFF